MNDFVTLIYVVTSIILVVSSIIVFITYREVKKVLNERISAAKKINSEGSTVKYHKTFFTLVNNNTSNSMLEDLILAIFLHSSTFIGVQPKKPSLQH